MPEPTVLPTMTAIPKPTPTMRRRCPLGRAEETDDLDLWSRNFAPEVRAIRARNYRPAAWEKSRLPAKGRPQRLKAHSKQSCYRSAEAQRPQKQNETRSSKIKKPSPHI